MLKASLQEHRAALLRRVIEWASVVLPPLGVVEVALYSSQGKLSSWAMGGVFGIGALTSWWCLYKQHRGDGLKTAPLFLSFTMLLMGAVTWLTPEDRLSHGAFGMVVLIILALFVEERPERFRGWYAVCAGSLFAGLGLRWLVPLDYPALGESLVLYTLVAVIVVLVLVAMLTRSIILYLTAALEEREDALRELERVNSDVERLVEDRTEALTSKQTELKTVMRQLEEMARIDDLTGANNRRYFFELAELEMRRIRRSLSPVAALMIDIDHFKHVNDNHGHFVGDEVLQQVVVRLKENIREVDILGRYGGEEFVVLLPETPPEAALYVAERLRSSIAETPMRTSAGLLSVTVSLGLAWKTEQSRDIVGIIEEADAALYKAKRTGRNRVALANDIPHDSDPNMEPLG